MTKKELVFENVQKLQKWLDSKERKKDCHGVFVMIGSNKVLVGCVCQGTFIKAYCF
jgi:hypothetical protein